MPGKKINDITRINVTLDGNELLPMSKGEDSFSVSVREFFFPGAVTAESIQSNAVNAEKIAAGSIKAGKIDVNAINSSNIISGSINGEKIGAGAITGNNIAAGAIKANNIGAGAITGNNIAAGAIKANNIGAGAITGNNIAAGAIKANNIGAGQISTNQLNSEVITAISLEASNININNVVAQVINSIEIDTDNISANAITSDQIASNSITADNISANAITSDQIASRTITSNLIAVNNIISDNIAANSIDASKIAACSVGATALAAGAVTSQAIATNIIISSSIQSRNFDGFNYVSGQTSGDDILQFLDSGTQGFFLDERTGTAVFTDIIARDNVIAANYIKFDEETSGLTSLENGNLELNLDNETLSVEDGRIKIKQIPSNSVIDESLFTTPNTIFFGQNKTETFELPTLVQPIRVFGYDGSDTSTWGFSSTFVSYPTLANVNDEPSIRNGSNEIGMGVGDIPIYQRGYLFSSPSDPRNNLFTSEYIRDAGYEENYGLMRGAYVTETRPVLFVIHFPSLGISADQITGNIQLNNLKIIYDTSKINFLSDVERYNLLKIQTLFTSSSSTFSDRYGSLFQNLIINQVSNPTLLPDIYETTLDINLGSIKEGNNTQFLIVKLAYSDFTTVESHQSYLGYIPMSAQFTPETNLRFEVTGAVPSTRTHQLSDFNKLIPGKQLMIVESSDEINETVNPANPSPTNNYPIFPFEWSSVRNHQLGYPESDPNRGGEDLVFEALQNGNVDTFTTSFRYTP